MRIWHVQPGDTLYQIALSNKVSLQDLATANPGLDPNNLIAGQEVLIPSGEIQPDPDTPPCPSGVYWVVAAGDTLYGIAKASGVNLAALEAANPQVNPHNLQIGQEICLPSSGSVVPPEIPPCPSGLFWVVEPGDTVYSIAQATGFTIDEILAVNPSLDPNNLQPRTNICLPRGGLLP